MKNLFFGHQYNYSNLHYIGFILLIVLSTNPVYSRELYLDDFIESILKNNPGVQKILSEKDIAAASRDASLGIDDAVVGSHLNLSRSEPDKIFGFEADESDNVNFNLSYNRLFSNSGTRLSLDYNNLYTDRNPALAAGSQYYQPSFTVKLTQPLLKNAGGIQDSLNIKLSQIDFKLSGLSSQENLESYITQLASLYIEWYLASREVEISKEVHQQAVKQEALTRTKVQRQVIEPYELLRIQEIREDYYSRWQQALGRFTGLTHQIRYQINSTDSLSENKFVPVNPKNSDLLSPGKNSLRKKNYLATTSRLKSILDAIKEQQVFLLDAKDNSRSSDLNLSVGYSLHGIDEGLNDAHTSSLDKNDYSVMLEYKYPLGNRQADGNFQAQLAKKRQIESDSRQRLIDAEANLANLEVQSSQLKVALKSIDRKIVFGKKKLKQESRLYNIGKLDLFELLKDHTSHLESRLNRERLYTQQLTLQLKIGELLDRNLETYSTILNSGKSKTTTMAEE